MKRVFLYGLLIITVLSCSKDKFESRPTLEFKSANTDVLPVGADLRIELEFTDKEGDLDSAFIYRKRLNVRDPGLPTDPIGKLIPVDFNNETKGILLWTLNWGLDVTQGIDEIKPPGSGQKADPDTLQMKFIVKDMADHVSDTVTRVFIVIRQI
jgi:hypothetical protein